MVRAVRRGQSQRSVARQFGVSLCTVQRWVARAHGRRLDRVDFESRSHRPERTTRAPKALEDEVLSTRRWLREESDLGYFGARSIRHEMIRRKVEAIPSLTTIKRILRRRDAVSRLVRVRHPAPRRGWYLPEVAAKKAELDSFDFIEDLVIRGGPRFDVLTGISLHGGLPAAFPIRRRSTATVVQCLLRHWRRHGLPDYAQFDNDTVFQGAHQFRDTVGRVTRLCLGLGVTPVFAPPREHGVQNLVESFNSVWKAKLWRRRTWRTLAELRQANQRYLKAAREYRADRIAKAPSRRPFPPGWQLDLDTPFQGRIVYLRRIDDEGRLHVLGHVWPGFRAWSGRRVRTLVELDSHTIGVYAISSKNARQRKLKTIRHRIVQRPFQG